MGGEGRIPEASSFVVLAIFAVKVRSFAFGAAGGAAGGFTFSGVAAIGRAMVHEIHARNEPTDPWKLVVRTETADDVLACFDVLVETGRYAALEVRTEFSSRPLKTWLRPLAPRVAPPGAEQGAGSR